MTPESSPYAEKTITHVYVADAQKSFVRPCWKAEDGLYCGMCMRGTIEPVVGAVCSICSSTVERILEITPGGKPKLGHAPVNGPIRVERKKPATGVLLDFWNSREAGA